MASCTGRRGISRRLALGGRTPIEPLRDDRNIFGVLAINLALERRHVVPRPTREQAS